MLMKSINHRSRILHAFIALVSVFVFFRSALCAPVSIELAEQVAKNLLAHTGSANTIVSVEARQKNGQNVAYLLTLSPRGYILVAGDDVRVPVKAYSLSSNFSDLPEAYVRTLLRELEVQTPALKRLMSARTGKDVNAPYWEYLKQTRKRITGGATIQSYTPDTFLLTTQWNQTYPYNSLNPTIDGEHTLTGCTQTAIAQIMRYHSHPTAGSGVFTHNWNSQVLTAVMNRPFNWSCMPDSVNGSIPEYQREEVAALMRDLGILNRAYFGLGGTSAGFYYWDFERAFGYAPISSMSSSDPAFFTTITSEIDNMRPVLLNMPGHMTVADGYASDGTGRKIHVNLGWGGAYDDYFYLDQTNGIGPYSFDPDHTIYYNIRPCVGAECDPYSPTGGGQPPVINSTLPDRVIDSGATLRLDIYDPDADTVTLSASSSCSGLQTTLDSNLLTLTPLQTDIFCQLTVEAQSHDGAASKTFNVLCLDEMVYLGSRYDIGGRFSDQNEVDEYQAYLGGDIAVSGDRGYSNQAFYIWVKNQNGDTVIAVSDAPISGNLSPGIYTICASLCGVLCYPYEESHGGYILSVTANDLTYTVSDLAADMGISLSTSKAKAMPWIPLLLSE